MSDPEVLKQILRDTKQEIEKWPQWMKSQEPALCGREDPQVRTTEPTATEDERLTA